jgi:hypothetical protein
MICRFYELDPHTSKAVSRSASAAESQPGKGEAQTDFTSKVCEGLHRAMEAKSEGNQGKAEALVKHAKKSLDVAKQAQRHGHNERLTEGVYALGDAIEHGRNNRLPMRRSI